MADQLITAAEDAGARLVPGDTMGGLERVTASGHTIRFRPVQRWPNWGAAVGDLLVGAPGKAPAVIASEVEVVNDVIPAFIEPEGRYLVFESGRAVYVLNLQTGARRKVGDGIAPRLIPLTDSFVYLRQKQVQNTATGASITYETVQQKLADGPLVVAGEIGTSTDFSLKGNYSPVRWMRVRELDGDFVLTGERMRPFRLELQTQ